MGNRPPDEESFLITLRSSLISEVRLGVRRFGERPQCFLNPVLFEPSVIPE